MLFLFFIICTSLYCAQQKNTELYLFSQFIQTKVKNNLKYYLFQFAFESLHTVLPFERHQNCNFQNKTNRKFRGHHLTLSKQKVNTKWLQGRGECGLEEEHRQRFSEKLDNAYCSVFTSNTNLINFRKLVQLLKYFTLFPSTLFLFFKLLEI